MQNDVVTPDTIQFLWLGLAVTTVIMVLFVASLWVRFRNLARDEAALEEITREN